MNKDNINLSPSSTKQQVADILKSLQSFSVYNYLFQTDIAHKHGLHPTDLLALHHIGMRGKMTPKDVSAALQLSSGATTALLDRLERKQLISRQASTTDRRKVIVTLVKDELNPLRQEYQAISKHMTKKLSTYSAAELEVIHKFLADAILQGSPTL